MRRIGLIGGTGAARLIPKDTANRFAIDTPFGPPSSAIRQWQTGTTEWVFIARHGDDGRTPPHLVNYRANIWALRQTACEQVLGINAVGGIAVEASPGRVALPDQLIDYTWGRQHSFVDGKAESIQHVDFGCPITTTLHAQLITAADTAGLDVLTRAVYAVTQGPRLETAAEIDRLERDGCDVVGMTAMPEAGLARELELEYAICAPVVNWAAGRSGESDPDIHAEIDTYLEHGMAQVAQLLRALGKQRS